MVEHYQAYLIRQKARYKGHVFFTINQNPSFTAKTIVKRVLIVYIIALGTVLIMNMYMVQGIPFISCSEVTKWLLNRGETKEVTTAPRFWGLDGFWRTGIPTFPTTFFGKSFLGFSCQQFLTLGSHLPMVVVACHMRRHHSAKIPGLFFSQK